MKPLARVELLVRAQVPQLGEATAALDALVRTLLANPNRAGSRADSHTKGTSALGMVASPENALVVVSPELSIDGKSLAALEARMQSLACVSLLLRHCIISCMRGAVIRPRAVMRLAACLNTLLYGVDISHVRKALIRLDVFSRPAFCVNVMVL